MPIPIKKQLHGFDAPVELPASDEQHQEWQNANADWWQHHPMRYDFGTRVSSPEFTREFYEEIDHRFFGNAAEYMPWKGRPFDTLIPFDDLPRLDVLEIGVGNGSHAALIAPLAKSFVGVDLTEYAVRSTRTRLEQSNVGAQILQMDAEKMTFRDASFDLVWSWGVIHHSANTRQVLQEIQRVLRPGGRAVLMVYHRSFWYYYIICGLFHGILRGQLFRHGSLHKVSQRVIDGALARYYTPEEWTKVVGDLFQIERLFVCGAKADLVPLPAGRLKSAVLRWIPNPVSRFFTNNLGMGYFLVSELSKSRQEE